MMQDLGAAAQTSSLADTGSDDLLEDVFAELDVGEDTASSSSNVEKAGAPEKAENEESENTGASQSFQDAALPVQPPVATSTSKEEINLPTSSETIPSARPVTFFEQGDGEAAGQDLPQATSTIDDYYASSTTWSENVRDDDATANSDDEDDSPLNKAIPVEKLKNGARTAMDLWSWGFGKVKEVAAVAAENERVKQASQKVSDAYDSNLRPGVEKMKEAAAPVVGGIKEGASSAYNASKPKFDELREKAAPAFEELGHKASEGWDVTKSKASQLGEACRPGLDKAAASTREIFNGTGIRRAASNDSAHENDAYEPFSTGKPIVSETVNPLHSDI